jgi:hypothetical protein
MTGVQKSLFENARAVRFELRADQLDVLGRIQKTVGSAVEWHKPSSPLDKIQERFFLFRPDARGVRVNRQANEPRESGGVQVLDGVGIDQVDPLTGKNRLQLFEPISRLVVSIIPQEENAQRPRFRRGMKGNRWSEQEGAEPNATPGSIGVHKTDALHCQSEAVQPRCVGGVISFGKCVLDPRYEILENGDMHLLVTGGAGFIGSNFIQHVIDRPEIEKLINADCLTYAGHLENLASVEKHVKYRFEKIDLRDKHTVLDLFRDHPITHVLHLAAESHVDRSITAP